MKRSGDVASADEMIHLGVLNASSSQLTQIQAWCSSFGRHKASVEAITEVGLGGHDLYVVLIDSDSEADSVASPNHTLVQLVQAAGVTPILALTTQEDEAVIEQAARAGVADCLVMETLDAKHFERAVSFACQRRLVLENMRARERALVEAFERQNQQLANALHDVPLQDLIGARFLVGALAAGDATADIQESLQAVIQFLRSLGSELKPPALGPFGLEKALRAHLQAFQARNPEIQLSLELENDRQQWPEWARYALFRIYQAAVENVAKHAQATQMRVRLGFHEEFVRLTVADDGQGFDLPESWLDFAYTGRYGLLIMQERVDALRGRMMVQSISGSGTRVTVQAPLDQPPLSLNLPMESHVSSSLPSPLSSLPLLGQKTHVPPKGQAPSIQDRNG